jgi:hypothetical protein
MTIQITQGLNSTVKKGQYSDWRHIVTCRLASDYQHIASSDRTKEAETGLAISPPCAYWFFSRVDDLYGSVLMVWRSVDGADLSSEYLQVAPYDTGGLWHGHIKMSRTFSPACKRSHVRNWSTTPEHCIPLFLDWLRNVFSDSGKYVAGTERPRYVLQDHMPPSGNNCPAWSWELRCPKVTDLTKFFTLDAIFMTKEAELTLRSYIQETYDGADMRQLLQKLSAARWIAGSNGSSTIDDARNYVSDSLRRILDDH